jgi:hypothetical protein
MELWRGTMATHSVIAYAGDAAKGQRVDFTDEERWPGYVPVRLPWTQLIQERPPAGAAGVLLNRNHPFPDLVLVLDPEDKRLFAAIDGRRTIAEITGVVPGAGLDGSRLLFQRLWWYDQVVFDASGG